MWTSNDFAPAALAMFAILSVASATQAADLNGAWASDPSVCSKVFMKNGNEVSMTPDSELYGGGFIVQGNRATGTFQKCNIKSLRHEGSDIHLIATCSTGVMVTELRFIVKFVGENTISVISTGPVKTENPYVRCSL